MGSEYLEEAAGAALGRAREKEAARLEREEQARDPVKHELCFLIPSEKFALRRADGSWDLSTLVGRPGAEAHLLECDIPKATASEAINSGAFTRAYGSDCAPGEAAVVTREGRGFINSWIAPTIIPRAGEWPRIRRIMEFITGNDPAGIEWLMSWCAFKLQHPGALSLVAPVFQGAPGSGKTSLGQFLGHALGRHNYVAIGQKDVTGDFDAHFVPKLLVLANEVVHGETLRATEHRLKEFIADTDLWANPKGSKQFPVKNRMSWWFTSNMSAPVRVEEGDRRYTIFRNFDPVPEAHKAMLRSMYTADNDPTPDAEAEIAAWAFDLLALNVDRAKACVPFETQARRDLIDSQKPSAEAFLDAIDSHPEGVDGLLTEGGSWTSKWDHGAHGVAADGIFEAYKRFCERNGFRHPVTRPVLGKVIADRRPKWARHRMGSGSRPWVYLGLPRKEPSKESLPS